MNTFNIFQLRGKLPQIETFKIVDGKPNGFCSPNLCHANCIKYIIEFNDEKKLSLVYGYIIHNQQMLEHTVIYDNEKDNFIDPTIHEKGRGLYSINRKQLSYFGKKIKYDINYEVGTIVTTKMVNDYLIQARKQI